MELKATKKCTACGEEKNLTEFHNTKANYDGKAYKCKVCCALYNKERRVQKLSSKTETPLLSSGIHTFIPRFLKVSGNTRPFLLMLCPRCPAQVKVDFFNASSDTTDEYYGGCDKCGCEIQLTVEGKIKN